MRIIILGAPGSGKGTQSPLLIKKYGINLISTGDILRTAVKEGKKIGKKVKEMMNSGKLVTEDLIIYLVKKIIYKENYRNGFLLDGFPRTILQAKEIKKIGINIHYLLYFHVHEKILINRIYGRIVHSISGRVYHIKFHPPKLKNKDDVTGEKLMLRKDDREKIFYKRWKKHNDINTPLTYFYQKESKIGTINYYKIYANRTIHELYSELTSILEEKI